jgi:fermentation-respiration switch protein FrsA (DUF1100 family)
MQMYRTSARVGVPAAEDAVASIAPRPLLIMHGTADKLISHTHSEELFRRAEQPKEFWKGGLNPYSSLHAGQNTRMLQHRTDFRPPLIHAHRNCAHLLVRS